MRRELPPKPNLEHLKSQAKDLLDAHKRGEPEALARIRAAVPAFAHRSDEEIARAPFALHDAQSAIAREYGCVSWAELRTRIAAGEPPTTVPEIDEASIQTITGRPVSPELEAKIREAAAQSRLPVDAATPATAPVLPLRNSVVFPGSLIPMDLFRETSLRAIDAVMQREPRFIAVFAQRAVDTERPTADDLHPKGSLCIVRVLHHFDDQPPPSATGEPSPSRARSWILVQGVRWIRLDALEQLDPYYVARISDADEVSGDAPEVAEQDRELRVLAHRFADLMPANRDRVHAVIDQTTAPLALADLVIANFPISVADKASYAEETQLTRKLDRAITLLTSELAKAEAAPT